MQKIRKLPSNDFSLYIKNLILDPLRATFSPKPENKIFPKNVIYVNFKFICYYKFEQKKKRKIMRVKF